MSSYNDYFASWPYPFPVVQVGDAITMTITAKDPNDDPLEYTFTGTPGNVWDNWSSNNTFIYQITEDDVGEAINFSIYLRDDDPYNRAGLYDDAIGISYEVAHP